MRNVYYLFSVKDKLFTELSLILKNKKLFDSFYGLAYARNSVLKNPIYTNVSYVTDITKKNGEVDYDYLETIEKKYYLNLSEMLHADRHLSKYNKKKRLFVVQEMIKLLMKELEDFQITHVYIEGVDDFISYFASQYCKQKGITLFYCVEIGYAERSCFSSIIYPEPDNFRDLFREQLPFVKAGKVDVSATELEIQQYTQAKKKPKYYLAVNQADYRVLKFQDIKIFFQYLIDYVRDHSALPYEKNPLLLPFYRLKKVAQKLAYKRFLKKHAVKLADIKNKNYLIYPLHFEPESSTLIQGRWLHDQRKIIEMISKNLPINTILVVKEHRISIGRRELKFYKDIAQYHNVFFVDDRIDTYQLINGSKGVVVISSTMGLEALMLQKPVMSFGERFYNVSHNVFLVENIRMIGKQLSEMLQHTFDYVDCVALIHTLLATTRDLGTLSHLDYSQKDLEVLAAALVEQYG